MLAITDIDLALKRCRHTSIANDRLDFAFALFSVNHFSIVIFCMPDGISEYGSYGFEWDGVNFMYDSESSFKANVSVLVNSEN